MSRSAVMNTLTADQTLQPDYAALVAAARERVGTRTR